MTMVFVFFPHCKGNESTEIKGLEKLHMSVYSPGVHWDASNTKYNCAWLKKIEMKMQWLLQMHCYLLSGSANDSEAMKRFDQ